MVENISPLIELDEQGQAAYFHARERRRSLVGIVELFRTHRISGGATMPVADIPIATFPVLNTEVTFKTAIRIADNAVARAGLIFEFGSSVAGVAIWLEDQIIGFRAGATGNDGVAGTFDNGVQWPATLELDLVAAVRPGLGLVALWANGKQIIKAQSVASSFTSNEWAAASAGSFAAAVQGTTPADVAQTGAPANFEVIEPLSVYIGQRPRHFTTPAV